MMHKLFYLGTVAFWLAVAAIWQGSGMTPQPAPAPAPVAAAPVEKRISLAEVARHNKPGDCWTVINGQVYDLSGYGQKHPSRPVVAMPSCGRDASRDNRTRSKGRPLTPDANTLLADFRIGPQGEP